jgi:hypothetical protein
MTPEMEIGTDRKALQINLDPAKYGTFAEIGAGQEVARRFFRIGGAAGTIAKTMSAYGRMFKGGLKLYVYPMIDEASGKVVAATQIEVAPNLRSLFRYLIDNQYLQEITDYHPEYLRIHPPDVLARLQSGDSSWERMVPPEVVHLIKKREFFGYRRSIAA